MDIVAEIKRIAHEITAYAARLHQAASELEDSNNRPADKTLPDSTYDSTGSTPLATTPTPTPNDNS